MENDPDEATEPMEDGPDSLIVSPRTCPHLIRWSTQLSHDQNMEQVEPLHLLASLFDQESERSSEIFEILKQVGVSKEAVIAELRSS
jgi:Clp amino terminal domain, pathogenicity island component